MNPSPEERRAFFDAGYRAGLAKGRMDALWVFLAAILGIPAGAVIGVGLFELLKVMGMI